MANEDIFMDKLFHVLRRCFGPILRCEVDTKRVYEICHS